MRLGGIICEYNPFHNGHAFLLLQLRLRGVTHIACFMSPNMVQRGELAQTDKWQRAAAAVENGADIVFELPVPYVLSSADIFARGGISLMQAAGCTDLCFGSEADGDTVFSLCERLSDPSCQDRIKRFTGQGLSYPAACAHALGQDLSPNDMLGVCYLTACKELGYSPAVHIIRRIGAGHDSEETCGSYASASFIRKCISSGECASPFAPVPPIGGVTVREGLADPAILYVLRSLSVDSIREAPEVSEGLENRICNAAKEAKTLGELLNRIKTKRYPMARIKRSVLSSVIGLTRADTLIRPPYLRVLASNERGLAVLSAVSKKSTLPAGTSLKKLETVSPQALRFSRLEQRCTDLFSAGCGFALPAFADYTVKPYMRSSSFNDGSDGTAVLPNEKNMI